MSEIELIDDVLSTIELVADPMMPKRVGRMSQDGYQIYSLAIYSQRLQFIKDRLQQLKAAREIS